MFGPRSIRVPSLLVKAGALAAWAAYSKGRYGVSPMADEVHHGTTPDGWRIALSRWRPVEPARPNPVVLVPGLSANRATFDLTPSLSLARYLASQRFDVWCVELRGHGLSDRPSLFGHRRYGWTFDDHLHKDIPTALEVVRAETGAEQVDWIGHSMGGLLLYAYLASGGSSRVRSGIAIGSGLDYSGTDTDFVDLVQLRTLADVLPAIPFGPLAVLSAPLSGRFQNRIEEFNIWLPNVDPEAARRLNASAFHPVSSPVLRQLATILNPGGLRARDGRICYMQWLKNATTPVLGIAGDRDRQCSPEAARRPLEALGARLTELVVCGPKQGHEDHYGHFDLIIGRRARTEVWPLMVEWLARDSS